MNPIGMIVNNPRLENRPRLPNSQRTSHGSAIRNLGPERERKSIKQKWVVFLRQCFRGNTDIRRRKTKVRMHTTVLRISELLNQRMRRNPRMKFPPASDTEARCILDNIISKTPLEEIGNKDYNQRLNESSQVIYTISVWECTGWKEIISHQSKRTNIKEWCRISEWRREI